MMMPLLLALWYPPQRIASLEASISEMKASGSGLKASREELAKAKEVLVSSVLRVMAASIVVLDLLYGLVTGRFNWVRGSFVMWCHFVT